MAVQKDYQKYIDKIMINTIFEGDRLFTKNNLIDVCKKYETKIIILENDKQTLQKRHIERGDNQSEKFKKGRATKINNIELEEELQPYITKYILNNHEQSIELAKNIVQYLNH